MISKYFYTAVAVASLFLFTTTSCTVQFKHRGHSGVKSKGNNGLKIGHYIGKGHQKGHPGKGKGHHKHKHHKKH